MKPALSPAHWPFEQPHVLLAIKQREHTAEQERLKASTSIRDVDFQSSDDEGTGYSPSENSESEEEDDGSEEDEEEGEEMDVDVDEVQDLTRDVQENKWPSSPTPEEKERAEEKKFKEELRILDAAEKEAAAAYNPDEVVALLSEFYSLLVELAHWPLGVIQSPPHTDPAVNIELAQELGFDAAVVELMQKLPYVKDEANQNENFIIPDSFFYNYTKDKYLREAKKHRGYDRYEASIDSWILPLAAPRNRDGWSVVLDTRLGVIRACAPMSGPPKSAIECRHHEKVEEEEGGPLEYHRAPLVPAAKYLRTLIDCYRSLDRVPMMDTYHSDPDFAKGAHREGLNWYFENMQDEQASILALYKECGWPDHWDRPTFVEKWEVLQAELKERGRERMKRDGALK